MGFDQILHLSELIVVVFIFFFRRLYPWSINLLTTQRYFCRQYSHFLRSQHHLQLLPLKRVLKIKSVHHGDWLDQTHILLFPTSLDPVIQCPESWHILSWIFNIVIFKKSNKIKNPEAIAQNRKQKNIMCPNSLFVQGDLHGI